MWRGVKGIFDVFMDVNSVNVLYVVVVFMWKIGESFGK